MIELNLSIEDTAGPALERFGDVRNQSRILNFVLARIGRRYRTHLRANYLSGQMINGGRGADSLSGRITVYKDKRQKNVYRVGEKASDEGDGRRVKLANIYEHAGGYTIIPKRRKILMFVDSGGFWNFAKKIEGKARPFMSASFASFGWNDITRAEVDSVIAAELKKAGLA
ncbi:MAG: hypothetical protein A2001_01440 [Treponema sp. GWC1_61_84]|nr:MAG: hypothetical protein A2001_01440 [Treponema sp. GWC1_61_84]